MHKRVLSLFLVFVISFLAIISASVPVYADIAGYSWEDYYYFDNDDLLNFNDAFYDLTVKEKAFVIIDVLANADDRITAEYFSTDQDLLDSLNYVAGSVIGSVGIIGDVISTIETASSFVSLFINLFDNGEITVDSDGDFSLSSDAVNKIRSSCVEYCRIVTIDEYNAFCFGSYFGTAQTYSTSDVFSENYDAYSYYWNAYTDETYGADFVVVPEWIDSDTGDLSYSSGNYVTNALRFYPVINGSDSGRWHISSYADGNLDDPGYLYYDDGYPVYGPEIFNLVYSTPYTYWDSIRFGMDAYWNCYNYGVANEDTLVDSADTSLLYYSSSSGAYYRSSNGASQISQSSAGMAAFVNYLTTYGSFGDRAGASGTYNSDVYGTSIDDIPYRSYNDDSYLDDSQSVCAFVMLPYDAVLVDDMTGTIYTYNSSGGGYYVSGEALEDANDGDNTNSPSKKVSNQTIVNVINNYEQIIYEITEDNSVTNVTTVINNYIVEDGSDDDSDDDSGSGSGSGSSGSDDSGSSDSSDSSTIIEWLKKIYNTLCSFYDDAIGYLFLIRSNTADLRSYVYAMKDDLSAMYTDVNAYLGQLRTLQISTNGYLSNIYDYVAYIYDRLYDLDYLQDIYSFLSDICDYLAGSSPSVLSDLYDTVYSIYVLLADIYADFSSYLDTISGLLSTVSARLSYIYGDTSSLVSGVNDIYDYLEEIYIAILDTGGYSYLLYDIYTQLGTFYDDVCSYLNSIKSMTQYMRESSDSILDTLEIWMPFIYDRLGEIGGISSGSGVDYGDALEEIVLRLDDLYLYFTGDLWELLTNLNNYVISIYDEMAAFPVTLSELFSEYFMDTFYTSQTVFEIIRGDLDMLYQMLAGETDSLVSDIKDTLGVISDALTSIASGDTKFTVNGMGVIEALLTGIAALMAVDTITDLIDFADDELDDYLDSITDSLSALGDTMTGVFPFCIPWDLLAILALFAAEPEAPVFELPLTFDRLGIDYTITVDFSEYEQTALICRTLLTCLFVVGLGYLTIRITHGGSGEGGDDV